MPEIPGDFWRT